MARESSITYDEVALICDEMASRAERVTPQRVHQALDNRGAVAAVTRLVEQWRSDQARRRPAPAMPDSLSRLSAQWMENFWQEALAQADLAYQEKSAALEEVRKACEAEVAEARTAREAVEKELAALRRELDRLAQRSEDQEEELRLLRSHEAAAQATIAAQAAQLSAMNEEVSRLQMGADLERRQHFDEIDQLQQQQEQTLAAVRESHQGELARIKDLAETERRRLTRETEELRQVAQTREETLCEQLAAQTAYVEQYRQQSQWAREQALKASGRVEALREQLSAVQEELAALKIRYAVAESLIPNPDAYRDRIRMAAALNIDGAAAASLPPGN